MAAGITRDHPLLLQQESVDGHLGTRCLADGGKTHQLTPETLDLTKCLE